ncbi:GspE/PulE family protein [Shewanella colwelliana]|uniref:GspE/PulE family protein n=1 Tax=Shewanella colwelliana TaxID=23 RepID=UPI0022AF73EF|nr:ATPase, T2SS/T4P/T4SS family [Shewanella colwelliana]MCZ4337758.1 ATPase, T2SS/T4P/T4SS family [Shewanella colwelliana]
MGNEYKPLPSELLTQVQVLVGVADLCKASIDDKPFAICEGGILLISEEPDMRPADVTNVHNIAARESSGMVETFTLPKVELIKLIGLSDSGANARLSEEETNMARDVWNSLLYKAVHLNASDIHIRLTIDNSIVYYRVDGILMHYEKIGKKQLDLAVNQFVNGANLSGFTGVLDMQDVIDGTANNFKITSPKGESYFRELRLNVMPVHGGRKCVVRINSADQGVRALSEYYYDQETEGFLRGEMEQLFGTILVTGPTGSGKTNLLASLLVAAGDDRQTNTIEDPVEIKLPNIDQATVIHNNPKASYDHLLTAMLRQDPDVLSVGEIRSALAAKKLFGFARTGHLTLSTVHVNSATQAPERLLDMGVEFGEMKSTLSSVIGVRLIPLLCEKCKLDISETDIAPEERRRLLTLTQDLNSLRFKSALGCPHCKNTGIVGRRSVIEYIKVSEDDYPYIEANNVREWERHLRERGWLSMGDRAREIIKLGLADPFLTSKFVSGVYDVNQ